MRPHRCNPRGVARARYAQAAERLARLDADVLELQRQQVDREIAERERRDQLMADLRDMVNAPLPRVPRSMEEHRAELARLDRYVDRLAQAEQDERRRYIDECESRRRWDWQFRARYDRHHPGGAECCTCDAHRAWRQEPPR